MSHFTTITTSIQDPVALQDACAELGLSLDRNANARGYNTSQVHGEFVIRLRGPYDIAVNRQPDGSLGLTTDWWGGHVEREVGPGYGRLLQLYGVHKATREARRKGYAVRRQPLANGSIKLSIEGV